VKAPAFLFGEYASNIPAVIVKVMAKAGMERLGSGGAFKRGGRAIRLIIAILMVLLWGAVAHAAEDLRWRSITPEGDWVHTGSGVVFPAKMGDLKLAYVIRLDDREKVALVKYLSVGDSPEELSILLHRPVNYSLAVWASHNREGVFNRLPGEVLQVGSASMPNNPEVAAIRAFRVIDLKGEGKDSHGGVLMSAFLLGDWQIEMTLSSPSHDAEHLNERLDLLTRSIGWPKAEGGPQVIREVAICAQPMGVEGTWVSNFDEGGADLLQAAIEQIGLSPAQGRETYCRVKEDERLWDVYRPVNSVDSYFLLSSLFRTAVYVEKVRAAEGRMTYVAVMVHPDLIYLCCEFDQLPPPDVVMKLMSLFPAILVSPVTVSRDEIVQGAGDTELK